MQIERISDVLAWTREFHQHLAECIRHCADANKNAKAKMLLDYLSRHEKRLLDTIKGFEESAEENALNTWVCEFIEKKPIVLHAACGRPFSEADPDEIMKEIVSMHGQVIGLYKYLHSQAVTPASKELLASLLDLEQNESMTMSHGANRMQDM